MAKPRDDLKKEEYFEEIQLLFEVFSSFCQGAEDYKKLLKELLTESEMKMLKRRWYIAYLLTLGKSIREVAHEANVSTATVVRVSHVLNNNSLLRKAFETLEKNDKRSVVSQKAAPAKKYIFGHN